MKRIFVVAVFVFLYSCSTVRVAYDFEKGTDFSSYTTYNYFEDMNSGLSQLDEKRLFKILDSTMVAKGFRLADEPDFLVNIQTSVYREGPGSNVGVGVGGGGRGIGGGVSVGIPISSSSLKRNIVLDFVDAERNQLIWQADTDSGFRDNASPSVREELLRKVVQKALTKFPPEIK